ncbi:MAG: efflux RND transporter periplasmic adaptor subunit [Halioglobus sp.]
MPLLFAACSSEPPPEPTSVIDDETSVVSAPIKVQTVIVESVDIADPLLASGTIAAKQTSNIGVLVRGVVEKIYVRVGDRVTKGQALFQTRRVDYLQQLSEVEAQLAIAVAEQINAENALERTSTLLDKGHVSSAVFDDVQATLQVAKSQVALRRTQVDAAKQRLDDTTVRSPFNGAITARYIDEGVFMANSFSGMGNSAVVQIQECEIAAGILFAPESEVGRLHLGLTGSLYVDGRDQPIRSEIIILNDRVDPKARTVEFRMAFLNEGCAVRAGQSVRAEVDVDPRAALVLPRAVLQGTSSSPYVFVVDGDRARRTSVTVQDIDAVSVEVLSGLSAADRVITGQFDTISDGTHVEVNAS